MRRIPRRQSMPPHLQQIAERLEADWGNEALHRALLELCAPSELAQVAHWYRQQQCSPERQTRAAEQLGRITTLAMASIDARGTKEASRRGQHWPHYVLILLFLIGSALLLTQF